MGMRKKQSFVELCLAELARDTEHMSEERQECFAAMLPTLSKLYRDDAHVKAVLIVCDSDSQTLIRINADEFEANGMLHAALPFHEELLKASGNDGVLQ